MAFLDRSIRNIYSGVVLMPVLRFEFVIGVVIGFILDYFCNWICNQILNCFMRWPSQLSTVCLFRHHVDSIVTSMPISDSKLHTHPVIIVVQLFTHPVIIVVQLSTHPATIVVQLPKSQRCERPEN